MENFVFHNTTELVFGKDTEKYIPSLIKKYGGKKVLLHYGGSSAEKNGLLPMIRELLTKEEIPFSELGGVVSNPRLSLVMAGIKFVKKEKCNFILAVGGGSVIDSAKAIAAGYYYPDIWSKFMKSGGDDGKIEKALPLGCVLTIPAAGSETSPSSVITNEETGIKRGCGCDAWRCKFAIVNPQNCRTVPDFHLASGIADMFAHVMERYFSLTANTALTDAMCESVMRTIMEQGRKTMKNRKDMNALAEIVLCGTMAHNDIVGIGRQQDWASHGIEHELSAQYDITHGSGLAIVFPAWLKFNSANADEKRLAVLKRYAQNVFGTDSVEDAIIKCEEFFRSIGMPTRLSELNIAPTEEILQKMSIQATRGRKTFGNFYKLTKDDIYAIYTLAK